MDSASSSVSAMSLSSPITDPKAHLIFTAFLAEIGLDKTLAIVAPFTKFFEKCDSRSQECVDSKVKNLYKILDVGTVNSLFSVYRELPQTSANGKILILASKTADPQYFLMKVPVGLSRATDSLSYEYYNGLVINTLKELTPCFVATYGRIACGIDPSPGAVCGAGAVVSHNIVEYIPNAITFKQYISSGASPERVWSVLMVLLWSLQIAQDSIEFVHNDLHLNNVLLRQLDKPAVYKLEYNHKKYTVELDSEVYIIDYGRARVTDAVGLLWLSDTESRKEYTTLSDFQKDLETRTEFPVKDVLSVEGYVYSAYNKKIHGYANAEDVLKEYYYNGPEGVVRHWYSFSTFNSVVDHYRLVRSVCKLMWDTDAFKTVDARLARSFPWCIPEYFTLPSVYKSLDGKNESPIDVLMYLYKIRKTFVV